MSRTVFKSRIDPSFDVWVVGKDETEYLFLSKIFKKHGHAFTLSDRNLIVVDGIIVSKDWFTDDHLLVIEAHEIGHHIIKKKGICEDQEHEADKIGLSLIRQHGSNTAEKIYDVLMKDRYNE